MFIGRFSLLKGDPLSIPDCCAGSPPGKNDSSGVFLRRLSSQERQKQPCLPAFLLCFLESGKVEQPVARA